MEEARSDAQQALEHLQQYEGAGSWYPNRARLSLAGVLHKLGRTPDATAQLDRLCQSIDNIENADDEDLQLLAETEELRRAMETGQSP